MITYDDSPATFDPPSLDFEHQYRGVLLIFDDKTWHEIIECGLIQTDCVRSKTGKNYELFREYKYNDQDILLAYPNTGASAAVIDMELLIASGIDSFVSFGTCGVFDPEIPQNSIIIPTGAVREEGVSYHYLPPAKSINFEQPIIEVMLDCVKTRGLPYHTGRIWTTDAVYRETAYKIKTMVDRECVGVDMELSALMAVAKFRKINFAGFLIADDLVPPRAARLATPAQRSAIKIMNLALDIIFRENNKVI